MSTFDYLDGACPHCREALVQIHLSSRFIFESTLYTRASKEPRAQNCDFESAEDELYCYQCYAEEFGFDSLAEIVSCCWVDEPAEPLYEWSVGFQKRNDHWNERREQQERRELDYHLCDVDLFEDLPP